MPETIQQFGLSWPLVLSQVVAFLLAGAIFIGLPLMVTLCCSRRFRGGGRLALWLAIVWLIPILGPLLGLAMAFLTSRPALQGR